jgi:hypothetical protein
MPDSLGFGSILALGLGSVWGTEVQVTQCVPIRSFSDGDTQYAMIADGTLKGFGDERTNDQGPLTVHISGEFRLRYTLANLLLRAFMGSLASNTYTMIDSLTGVFLTAAILRGGGGSPLITAYDSVKINELTIKSNAADGTIGTFSGIGRNFTDASGTNTSTVINALINNVAANVLHQDWAIRIGDRVDALAGGDAYSPSEWEFTLSRPMDETHITQFLEEPVDDGFKDMMLKLTFPRLSTTQFRTWRNANTRLQATFTATGAGGTKVITVPNMQITNWSADIGGPEHIQQEIEFQLKAGVDTVTGTNIDASTTDDSFNSASSAFPLVAPGSTVWASGFANSANNGRHTVVSGTTAKIIVTTNLTTEAAGATVTIRTQNPGLIISET